MIKRSRYTKDAGDIGGQPTVALDRVRQKEGLEPSGVWRPFGWRERVLADPVHVHTVAGEHDRARFREADGGLKSQRRRERFLHSGVFLGVVLPHIHINPDRFLGERELGTADRLRIAFGIFPRLRLQRRAEPQVFNVVRSDRPRSLLDEAAYISGRPSSDDFLPARVSFVDQRVMQVDKPRLLWRPGPINYLRHESAYCIPVGHVTYLFTSAGEPSRERPDQRLLPPGLRCQTPCLPPGTRQLSGWAPKKSRHQSQYPPDFAPPAAP